MSVVLVTTVGTTIGGIEAGAALLAAAPVAAWGAAMFAATAAAKAFGTIWNKTRVQIPNLKLNLESAQLKVQQVGQNFLQPVTTDITNNLANYLAEAAKVDALFNTNYQADIQKLATDIQTIDAKLLEMYQTWITTLALLVTAGSDNTFYTFNRNDLDKLIGAYVSNPVEVDSLVETVKKITAAWNALKNNITDWEETVQTVVVTTLLPKQTSIPAVLVGIETRTKIPSLDLAALIAGTGIATQEQIDTIVQTISRTKTQTKEKKRKKRKLRARRKSKKRRNPPKTIRVIKVDVSRNSRWIKSLEFRFPTQQPISSDKKGSLTFFLKKGGVIKKVRVNRGTFSTIVMWSLGLSKGVGYRYWSQFNKKAIVNRDTVYSWTIPRINKQDREIAIPIEIKEKRVKYR